MLMLSKEVLQELEWVLIYKDCIGIRQLRLVINIPSVGTFHSQRGNNFQLA